MFNNSAFLPPIILWVFILMWIPHTRSQTDISVFCWFHLPVFTALVLISCYKMEFFQINTTYVIQKETPILVDGENKREKTAEKNMKYLKTIFEDKETQTTHDPHNA